MADKRFLLITCCSAFLWHFVSQWWSQRRPHKDNPCCRVGNLSKQERGTIILGLANYYLHFYCWFCEDCTAHPLHWLTEKNVVFDWNNCQSFLIKLQYKLVTAPILAFPHLWLTIILDTDASYRICTITIQHWRSRTSGSLMQSSLYQGLCHATVLMFDIFYPTYQENYSRSVQIMYHWPGSLSLATNGTAHHLVAATVIYCRGLTLRSWERSGLNWNNIAYSPSFLWHWIKNCMGAFI